MSLFACAELAVSAMLVASPRCHGGWIRARAASGALDDTRWLPHHRAVLRHQTHVGCEVVFGHTACREPLLEAGAHRSTVQLIETPDGRDGGRPVLHDEA